MKTCESEDVYIWHEFILQAILHIYIDAQLYIITYILYITCWTYEDVGGPSASKELSLQ
jgi:hypothetical protein